MKQKILLWILDQAEKGKVAWTIITLLASLLGYQITISKTPDPQQTVNVEKPHE